MSSAEQSGDSSSDRDVEYFYRPGLLKLESFRMK